MNLLLAGLQTEEEYARERAAKQNSIKKRLPRY